MSDGVRLRHLDQLGIPEEHELVTDTQKLLRRMEVVF